MKIKKGPPWLAISALIEFVVITMIFISILKKSFFRLVPILISVAIGYAVAYFMGDVDLSKVHEASWIGLPTGAFETITTLPKFTFTGVIALAPIALVVFIEHIGDITTNGAVVGKDFFKDPGVHRTLLGDGLATMAAGLLGGPANTTYGENTGVLAVTKVYDPAILRIAACFAIVLGLIGKFGVILQTIPQPVMGGVSIILFGMIAAVGVRTIVEAQLDFTHSRNLIIAALIFVLGIAIGDITISENTLKNIIESFKINEDKKYQSIWSYYQVLTSTDNPGEHPNSFFLGDTFRDLGPFELKILYDNLNRKVLISRANGMKIFDLDRLPSNIRFSAIFILSGDNLNSYFKQMEAPQHDSWEPDRHPDKNAKNVLRELKQLIINKIIELGRSNVDEHMEVEGIGKFLPDNLLLLDASVENRKIDKISDETRKVSAEQITENPKKRNIKTIYWLIF